MVLSQPPSRDTVPLNSFFFLSVFGPQICRLKDYLELSSFFDPHIWSLLECFEASH
jgi:hypothetical protein